MTDYDFPFSDLLKLYPACQHDVVRKQGCDLQNVLRYSKLCAAIQWNGVIGNVFAIQCGVRQGGILSPMLFSIYIDERTAVVWLWNTLE